MGVAISLPLLKLFQKNPSRQGKNIDVVQRAGTQLIESGEIRGSKLERQADKMREIVVMLGWLTPLYLVCVLSQSA